jgi:hypothetical protein
MNYNNFARPESELGGIAELEAAELENMHFCEECGERCDTTFCSEECEADAHTLVEYDDDGQPSEYEEWQDLYGGDDWDHGQYDAYDGE